VIEEKLGMLLKTQSRVQTKRKPSQFQAQVKFRQPSYQLALHSQKAAYLVKHFYKACAVNFTPSARATITTVSKRGFAPGASAL
jgi:hypothetical protein